ncbi:MAG: hypothetical protein JOZ38_07660 [Candidatus Eremiobacteraeota bacterium]|nr:hypothetical protein [Candidatus Eremiobacteraeota bacterium]
MVAPRHLQAKPRLQNARRARLRTEARRGHNARRRYVHIRRFVAALAAVVFLLMSYVWLYSNLTSMNYAIERADRERSALQDQTARLDDRIAELRSHERLAAIASSLHMRDAQQYAIVALPRPAKPMQARIALFAAFSWFGSH